MVLPGARREKFTVGPRMPTSNSDLDADGSNSYYVARLKSDYLEYSSAFHAENPDHFSFVGWAGMAR